VFTEECFELDVSSDEIVKLDVSVFVRVSHHDCIERRIAHTVACISQYIEFVST